MFFVLAAGLASIGPGNIATAALVAPMAMATAARAGIPLFLMAIMVGNGANAGSLSPFAPTGIIVNGLMARIGMTGLRDRDLRVRTCWRTRWSRSAATSCSAAEAVRRARGGDGGREPPTRPTALRAAALDHARRIATLIVARHLPRRQRRHGRVRWRRRCWCCPIAADDREAIKRMPWNVIVMVCGVTVLIALLEKAQGIDLIMLAAGQAVDAATRSRRGRVPDRRHLRLQQHVRRRAAGVSADGADAGAAAGRRESGGDRDVDERRRASRRRFAASTIGALCIASVTGDESRRLFNQLLAWGLSMTVVGALLCYLVFRPQRPLLRRSRRSRDRSQ